MKLIFQDIVSPGQPGKLRAAYQQPYEILTYAPPQAGGVVCWQINRQDALDEDLFHKEASGQAKSHAAAERAATEAFRLTLEAQLA